MKAEIFRYFIRKNFEKAGRELSNEEIDGMGQEFIKYLDSRVSPEIKTMLVPKTSMEVIMRQGNPIYTNGFNPGFVLHFTEFIKQYTHQTED